MVFIDACLAQSGNRLFSAYRVLEEAQRTFDPNQPAYNKIKTARKAAPQYKEEGFAQLVQSFAGRPHDLEILEELQAARRIKRKADAKRQSERQLELEEEDNVRKAEAEGTMAECGCCFGDYPLNRMIHCNNDEVMHWFCRACARQSAETEIGNSKYNLRCMSMNGCEAGFSVEQRSLFLNANTIIALERNEQEAVLRMAGIENLASCPFCPYAAEYPPVDVDREFRCEAPECEKVSCRLCKLESHIPKSCEEHAKENGLSIRRQIEEAMSAALIRKCNKCGTPFVKEEGCNKMTWYVFLEPVIVSQLVSHCFAPVILQIARTNSNSTVLAMDVVTSNATFAPSLAATTTLMMNGGAARVVSIFR
jgi:TRIAD3 protein (E3 ubiquitin-protein ligase RNF216)